MTLTYASVCDGIGAAHVAWNPLGWRCAWTSEIDPFPAAVVDHHWDLPNLGDMTKISTKEAEREHGPIDLLVGGTPCQSFSVAGLRKGLDDPRGNLALVYLGLADQLRPRWVVWENVPGVLSSGGGRDFGSFLGALGKLGYGWSYRVMDAQYTRVQSHPRAVPQRRRRVFVVGYLGDWRRAAAVLFEREGMSGHPAPRRETGQGFAADAAPSVVASGRGFSRTGETRGQDPVVAVGGDVSHTLKGEGCDASEDGTGRGTPIVSQPYPVGNPLTARMHKGINTTLDEGQTPVLAFDTTQITHRENRSNPKPGQPSPTLNQAGHPPAVAFNNTAGNTGLAVSDEHAPPVTARKGDPGMVVQGIDSYNAAGTGDVSSTLGAKTGDATGRDGVLEHMTVRRLMPVECERLQGFPDHYTAIEYRGKPAADTPRYKALGNSMAVNVMSWIGQRISMVEEVVHA